ncbi:ribonuclease HII [Anaeromyxobacter diazotrophicus]|uniref:Ribonuclease HII n=1 Tax=Anaeromyxobacter diazotrophicus TaxID=2590199 RepID=A0A7I9VSU2_9BACT|nr:ribonuclease HII [Anaeromyxobacter diazotrophicus]GEJ59516.1 ribonuclease HII [Anaeromyxobacter diazotrophicus]
MGPDDIRRMSLAELKARFVDAGRPLPEGCEEALRDDDRAGARAVYQAVLRRRRENRAEGQRLRHLLRFETALWEQGVLHIGGVDEAGMAPLAGPVVAAAVILPREFRPRGIDDSKQVDAAERERLAVEIKAAAVCWAVGLAAVEEIDTINIYRAGLLAMRRAVEGLSRAPEHLLIDARRLPELKIPQQGIIHGDALSLTIAAASILAKTTRDALMAEQDLAHPGYGFARHKGYPTAEHFAALEKLGPSPLHRRSFAPVRQALGLEPVQEELFPARAEGEK